MYVKIKDGQHDEPSFVVKPFQNKKKERCTWLGRWEAHLELHRKHDSTKIAYVVSKVGDMSLGDTNFVLQRNCPIHGINSLSLNDNFYNHFLKLRHHKTE